MPVESEAEYLNCVTDPQEFRQFVEKMRETLIYLPAQLIDRFPDRKYSKRDCNYFQREILPPIRTLPKVILHSPRAAMPVKKLSPSERADKIILQK